MTTSRCIRRERSITSPAVAAAVALLLLGGAPRSLAQGTLADYERAEAFLDAHRLVARTELNPRWIAQSDRFWYASKDRHGTSFVLVDPAKGTQRPAFDHVRLAAALSQASGKSYTPGTLPFDELEYSEQGSAIEFAIDGTGWRCDSDGSVCTSLETAVGVREGEVLSPDGRWAVFAREHNLWARNTVTGQVAELSDDGKPDHHYGGRSGMSGAEPVTHALLEKKDTPKVYFSPDSSRLLSYRLDVRGVADLPLIQFVGGARPLMHSYPYPLAGDPGVARAQMILFDLKAKTRAPLPYPPLAQVTDYTLQVFWNEAGTRVYFVDQERGYKAARLQMFDLGKREMRTVLEEHSATYVDTNALAGAVGAGDEVIWSSQRDGWNHLYLIDAVNGASTQITRGEWAVRELLHVDAMRRQVYFTAAGRESRQDPYYRQLYRTNLDGTGLQRLTSEPADHHVVFSPSGRFYIDTYSRVDAAPVSVLRSTDGRTMRVLQRADIAPLLATGWKYPEPFTVKARDKKTDLYGVIYRPSNFDPARRYPVIDAIYPGPQRIQTPKRFMDCGVHAGNQAHALAELGFIVVALDGPGTPLRSRAFHEVSYDNMGDAGGLDDHIAALQQLAARHPSMDIARVGIYGHSAGGYASARALLKYPEFYRVAVSSSGTHELRSYSASWGERYQGDPGSSDYAGQANAPLAGNLEGKLLLVHGSLDDNVHITASWQLADALIEANQDFDLLILPNRNHALVDLAKGRNAAQRIDPYFVRKRWDYFVRHLLGVEPPSEYRL